MGLFGKRHQEEHDYRSEKRDDNRAEAALAIVSGRLTFLQALTSHLVAELPPKKRERLLEELREVVSGLMALPPPAWVPPRGEQDYHDEIRRDLELLIEKTANLTKPIIR